MDVSGSTPLSNSKSHSRWLHELEGQVSKSWNSLEISLTLMYDKLIELGLEVEDV